MYLARHRLYSWRTFCPQLCLCSPSFLCTSSPRLRWSSLEGKYLKKANDQTGKSHLSLMFIYVLRFLSRIPAAFLPRPHTFFFAVCQFWCQIQPFSKFLTGAKTDTPSTKTENRPYKNAAHSEHFSFSTENKAVRLKKNSPNTTNKITSLLRIYVCDYIAALSRNETFSVKHGKMG